MIKRLLDQPDFPELVHLAQQADIPQTQIILKQFNLGDMPVWRESQYWQLLTSEEINRATAFHYIQDQQLFLTGRILSRFIAADLLNIALPDIHICGNIHEKPFIKQLDKGDFNISHSGDIVFIGFIMSPQHQIGVDVEQYACTTKQHKNYPYPADILDYFGCDEAKHIRSLPDHLAQKAFYDIWCLKEATLKATGHGLSQSPDTVKLSILPNGSHLHNTIQIKGLSGPGLAIPLSLAPHYSAALSISERV